LGCIKLLMHSSDNALITINATHIGFLVGHSFSNPL
jgi:hypothetical protein